MNLQLTIINMLRCIAKLPLGALYLISDLMYPLMYYIVRYRRKMVRKNLLNSFPDKSQKDIVKIEKRFYKQLCNVFIESFKTLNISDEEMRRRVDVVNYELVERIAAEGRSVILLLGHCGCWEWGQEICKRYKIPHKNGEIYKHISSEFFGELMRVVRSHWDTTLIEMHDAPRTILQWSAEGTPFLVGFISDQRPYSSKRYFTRFLNQSTDYVIGGEVLAKKIGAELLYLDVECTSRGHYRLTFKEIHPDPADKEHPYTLEFYRMLETTILRQPEIWLWSHNRWKHSNYSENK